MPAGNISVQTLGGASTLGVVPASGYGLSFLDVLYRYANLTLPYNPNDPGLSFTYDNSTLVPVVLLYARFFNLLNEPSVALVANVGTSAFPQPSGANINCLDVRNFGAKGDGVTDDTAAVQAALDQAASNYLGNQASIGLTAPVTPNLVQSAEANIGNGSGTSITITLPLKPTIGNRLFVGFCAFNYNGAPTLTDNQGNVYAQVFTANNGQFHLYVYQTAVATAASTIITVSMAGKNFNSFISGIAAEMSGAATPLVVNGTASAIFGTTFIPATLPKSNAPSIAFSLAVNSAAAGVVPPTPPGFTFIGAEPNPQPNGLNGAVPVTAMAFQQWNGVAQIAPKWGGGTWNGVTLAFSVASAIVSLPASTGLTTVCIPAGVNCMVKPVALDERNFVSNSCRYGAAAYSLLIQDGVTLQIDGQLIANPAATEQDVIASPTNGQFGWFLIMNKNWLSNSSVFNPVKPVGGGSQFLDGVDQKKGSPITLSIQQGGNDLVLFDGNNDGSLQMSPPPSTYGFTQVGSSNLWQKHTTSASIVSVTESFANVSGDSAAALVGFKGIPGITPTLSAGGFSGGGGFFQFLTLSSTAGIPAGSFILAVVDVASGTGANNQAILPQLTSVADNFNGTYTIIVNESSASFNPGNSTYHGAGVFMAVCFNSVAVAPGVQINVGFSMNIGYPGLTASVYVISGAGACTAPLSWTDYINGTAINEGARNTKIKITGNGKVVLNGDNQVNVQPTGKGELFPLGLARFVCVDNSTIDSLEIVNPFGCAVQWLNSNNALINGLFVHDGVSTAAAIGAQDPGVIEVDMLRSSTIKNNVILNCSLSKGILDWAGFQLTIAGNTMTSDYTGYEYRDMGGEFGYFFTGGGAASQVTQNSEISQNKVSNCSTDPASPGLLGSKAGSNGFLFLGGFYTQAARSSVTGIRFHDNVGSGNSTDFSFDTQVSFLSNINNSFGGGIVIGGQNPVNGEVPTGTINGTNVTFTLAHIPIASTVQLFLNGLFETFGTDYTISGNTITFTTPPASGSTISVNYSYLSGN